MDFRIFSKLGILRCPPICATAASLIVAIMANPVMAEETHVFAMNFGELIGNAEACGVALDQSAIARVTLEHMKPGDLKFPGIMTGAISLTAYQFSSLSDSQKTAVCTTAKINAGALGILATPP